MVQRCWVNFQCRGVLLHWVMVGQGPTALAAGAGGVFGHFFSVYHLSFLSPSFLETARYRPKYCLKGPLNPKQPANQIRMAPSSSLRPVVQSKRLANFTLIGSTTKHAVYRKTSML